MKSCLKRVCVYSASRLNVLAHSGLAEPLSLYSTVSRPEHNPHITARHTHKRLGSYYHGNQTLHDYSRSQENNRHQYPLLHFFFLFEGKALLSLPLSLPPSFSPSHSLGVPFPCLFCLYHQLTPLLLHKSFFPHLLEQSAYSPLILHLTVMSLISYA